MRRQRGARALPAGNTLRGSLPAARRRSAAAGAETRGRPGPAAGAPLRRAVAAALRAVPRRAWSRRSHAARRSPGWSPPTGRPRRRRASCDLCAAPGTKTAQLAALARRRLGITAVDVDEAAPGRPPRQPGAARRGWRARRRRRRPGAAGVDRGRPMTPCCWTRLAAASAPWQPRRPALAAARLGHPPSCRSAAPPPAQRRRAACVPAARSPTRCAP